MPSKQLQNLVNERLIEGRLHVNPGGFGFVVPNGAASHDGTDIYISKDNLTEAMHGDRVLARVERKTARGLAALHRSGAQYGENYAWEEELAEV